MSAKQGGGRQRQAPDTAAPTPETHRARAAAQPARVVGAAWFLVAGTLSLAGVVLVAWLAILTAAGQALENLALLGAVGRTAAEREQSLARLAPISAALFALALLAVIGIGALRRRPGLGVTVAATMGLAVVIAELVKVLLDRPPLQEGAAWLLRNSFPSGTAAVAMAMATGLLLVAPQRLRWLALLLGAGFVGLVAHALQVAGWHRLSDVVGSALLVTGVTAVALAGLASTGRIAPSVTGVIHPGVYQLVGLLALLAIAAGGVVAVLPVALPVLASPDGSRRAFLQAAFPLLGAGASALLVVVMAKLIEPWSLGHHPTGARPPRADRATRGRPSPLRGREQIGPRGFPFQGAVGPRDHRPAAGAAGGDGMMRGRVDRQGAPGVAHTPAVVLVLAVVLGGCEALGLAPVTREPVFVAEPASADTLAVGDGMPFTMGHCGLSSPVDVDGSLWAAPEAAMGDVSFDSARGTFTLIEVDVATFVSSDGRARVRLTRHAGPMELPICR